MVVKEGGTLSFFLLLRAFLQMRISPDNKRPSAFPHL
jgi:hypothetical protein